LFKKRKQALREKSEKHTHNKLKCAGLANTLITRLQSLNYPACPRDAT